MHKTASADPGIFVMGGGGGVQVNLTKKSSDNLQRFFFFLVLSLFYRSQMVIFKGNYHFSRFQRVSSCLFSIETHITCDFPGLGPDPPVPPLDPHLLTLNFMCNPCALDFETHVHQTF